MVPRQQQQHGEGLDGWKCSRLPGSISVLLNQHSESGSQQPGFCQAFHAILSHAQLENRWPKESVALQLCILSMTSDHSSLAEENKPPAPSNTVIWLVQTQIVQGFPKSPKRKISFVWLNSNSLDHSPYIVAGFCASKTLIFSLR